METVKAVALFWLSLKNTKEDTALFENTSIFGAQRELVEFRDQFFAALPRWGDALFEMCDALLCAPSPVASLPHLSLDPSFRRSHGSLYRSLAEGSVEDATVRQVLVAHRPREWPLIFAVDCSVWDRCDAESSPERGFYYSATRHSNGQPIVAGWCYQWMCQLNMEATPGPRH